MTDAASEALEGAFRKRFYKIGEVAELTDLEPHVLRYWEEEFPPLRPGKSRGGQRLYTPEDIRTIVRIKDLLYEQGFTIAGARRRLRAEGAGTAEGDGPGAVVETLEEARREIGEILTLMEANDKQ